MVYLQLFGGLIYLLMGGDLLVRGAVALARRVRVPPVVIAVSVVAIGTSLPELVVTMQAVFGGYSGMAIGNVVGSNIANVLLVVGVPAIFFRLVCSERSARRNTLIMLGASAAFLTFCYAGELGRLAGVVLLAGLAAVMVYIAREATSTQRVADRSMPLEWVLGLPTKIWMIALLIVVGAVGLPLGSSMLIKAAVQIANQLQISDAVVGLSIVAIGTSLPELATSIIAAVQRQTGVSIGTAIGSNIFNILAIIGVTAAASPAPIAVPPSFLRADIPVMLGASLLLALLVWRGRPISRFTGAIMVLSYLAYLGMLFSLA